LEHDETSPHEEGYSFESYRWTFDGETVYRDWANGGRDCDGRIEYTGEDECPIADLAAHVTEFRAYPEWRESKPVRVYDQYAQAAGY
jgi:hypothetical protein